MVTQLNKTNYFVVTRAIYSCSSSLVQKIGKRKDKKNKIIAHVELCHHEYKDIHGGDSKFLNTHTHTD